MDCLLYTSRSDNERLRAKQDMLKRFVTEKFFNLSPDEDIVKAYEEFEVLQQNMDIEMFAQETNLDVETIRFFISEYQFKHVISLEDIRKRLSHKGYGLLQDVYKRQPKNREYVESFLAKLGLSTNDTLGIIRICKGLSLNDSYWVVEDGFDGKFENYNLYENKFSRTLALIAYTGHGSSVARGFTSSPEFTTRCV